MTHGSLFSGIGGFELGANKAGINTLWNCEILKKNRQILKKHFPHAKQYEDIQKIDEAEYVDIISGGFPCQDISVAGKGIGITGRRSGLWKEMYRVIRMVRPKYIIIENSPALLIRGFEQILCDLSKIGYNAEWKCLSCEEFGYPHKRERLFVIAYSDEVGFKSYNSENGKFESIFKSWAPNTYNTYIIAKRIRQIGDSQHIRINDGFSNWSHRVGSLGNAVNPTITHYLFECIKLHYKKYLIKKRQR